MELSKKEIEQLAKFLTEVHESGIQAASLPKKELCGADGSKVNYYRKGDWYYHDIWYGENPFSGQVTVSFGKIVWVVNYRGTYKESLSLSLLRFALKCALKSNPEVIRGPKEFITSDRLYKYSCSYDGDIEQFSGEEQLSIAVGRGYSPPVYSMKFFGGIVK